MQEKMKSLIQSIANSMGYEIKRLRVKEEERIPTNMPGIGEYTYYHPWGYHTYSPWWEAWFNDVIEPIKGKTLISEDRCYMLHSLCKYSSYLPGDFAECGAYKGGSAYLIAKTIQSAINGRRLHLFDTFGGMPDTVIKGVDDHMAGDFADTSLMSVKQYLSPFPFIVFHPGLIPGPLKDVSDRQFSFLHVDVDIYQTTLDCLMFFYERMVKGGIIIFDDYGFLECKGERKAVDEFFAEKKETPMSLPTGQCLVIKL